MKIVITGASGFIGRLLVIDLIAAGYTLLLVGRDAVKLREAFPDVPVCEYSQLTKFGSHYDMLVHLAVVNNDAKLPEKDYFATNVDFLLEVARLAKQAGIKRFVNFSSVHALDPYNKSAYARSKREGAAALATEAGIISETIFIPLVYSDQWPSKLKYLTKFPRTVSVFIFAALAAIKPTVHINKIVEFLRESSPLSLDKTVILSDDQNSNFVYTTSKRLFDLSFAVVIVGLLGWLLLLIWIAIRIESPGPGIFAQQRVGYEGKVFTCYKFRTMKIGTAQAGTHEISAAAVTKIGAFMRKTKIDELPQIWNIFRNEISLIGPRPCLPVQNELIEARKKLNVFSAKPGISGLAQINGVDMSEPVKLAMLDARYISLRSIQFDLKIIFATATGKGQGDKTISNS